MNIRLQVVDVKTTYDNNDRRIAEVYILDEYIGRFEISDYESAEGIREFIMDRIFTPAFDAAKEKFGVSDSE